MARREVLHGWKLVAAMLVAMFVACSDEKAPPPSNVQLGKGIYIGPEFKLARATTGHRVHVVAKKIECAKCHTPDDKSIGPPVKPERCAACHEKEAKLEHASAEAEKRFGAGVKVDCTTCHAFQFDGKDKGDAQRRADALIEPVDGGEGPLSVHGIEMFSPGDCKHCHETKQGDTPAVVSHLTQDCLACHKPHEQATPTSAACSDCHKDIATTHASEGKTVQETCSTCHENEHEPASAALDTCATCHATEKPVIPATALFESGHDNGHEACTNCHKPHHFERAEAAGCASCHTQKAVIGGAKIPQHNACANCHSPHNVRGSAAGACANCHKNVHPDHPKQGAAGTCVGCHDAHPDQGSAETGAVACSSCHKQAHSDRDFHRGMACEQCHKPHDFKIQLANVATCQVCHAQRVSQVNANAGHRVCTGCHQGLPHRPEPAEVGCNTCHASEHAKANKGHTQCTQCHEPHSGAQATACGNCHKEEHRTAPKGHQACANCHEPHGGATQKQCAACHSGQAKTPHGELASGCMSCHRPHGPSGPNGPGGVAVVPTCTSCHRVAQLPGLHNETKHQACTTCHGGHADLPGTTRTTCLNCHKDRTNHFPNADRCANCHLFTATR